MRSSWLSSPVTSSIDSGPGASGAPPPATPRHPGLIPLARSPPFPGAGVAASVPRPAGAGPTTVEEGSGPVALAGRNVYPWQRARGTNLFSGVMEHRRDILRQADIANDDQLHIEWVTLMAELDAALRQGELPMGGRPNLVAGLTAAAGQCCDARGWRSEGRPRAASLSGPAAERAARAPESATRARSSTFYGQGGDNPSPRRTRRKWREFACPPSPPPAPRAESPLPPQQPGSDAPAPPPPFSRQTPGQAPELVPTSPSPKSPEGSVLLPGVLHAARGSRSPSPAPAGLAVRPTGDTRSPTIGTSEAPPRMPTAGGAMEQADRPELVRPAPCPWPVQMDVETHFLDDELFGTAPASGAAVRPGGGRGGGEG